MDETGAPPKTLRFGPYEADLATGELRRDGARVPLQDKPFQMLALLLRRPGELVTREELRAALWPADTFVDFEHGLNTAAKKLRQALDDSAETPRFVETLPRRGYRFVATTEAEPAGRPTAPAPPLRPPTRPPNRGWVHAGWAAIVLLVAGLLWPARKEPVETAPARNARPVVVLMDSPLPGRVYDPRTFAAGGTNADDLTDALHDLPVVLHKENTSAMWHREDQVVRQNPDLIVSHLSCLLDARFGEPGTEGPVHDHLFTLARNRLIAVYGYVGMANPRTRFLVYSRSAFDTPEKVAMFVKDAETRFPALRGRLQTMDIPGDPSQETFRDPGTARLVRERVKAILALR